MAFRRSRARIAALEAQIAEVEARSTYPISAYSSEFRHLLGGGGVHVDADMAMRHDAVWACVTAISQDVSMLPVDVYRLADGVKVPVDAPQIITAPSVVLPDAMDWRYQILMSWLLHGNAWARVTKTTANSMYPARLEVLNPACVRPDGSGGVLVDGVAASLWPSGDLWHWPAYTAPGSSWGMSPIEYHARSIGVGLSAEKFGADFFDDGGHPSAVLSMESAPSLEQAEIVKRRFRDVTRGNRDVIILPKTTTYSPIQVNPEDSQFLNAMRYSAEQIIRIYREDVSDYSLSSQGTSVTYANRTDNDLARFKRRQFWVTKLQNALTSTLPRPQFVKLNASAALMMSAKERHDLYRTRLDASTMTVNEVRRIEDETPFGPEYDAPGVPALTQGAF